MMEEYVSAFADAEEYDTAEWYLYASAFIESETYAQMKEALQVIVSGVEGVVYDIAMVRDTIKNFAVGKDNKRIVITPGFVEMGVRQAEANRGLGEVIASSCDYAIVVNATNREAIKEGIKKGRMDCGKVFYADSLNQAHAHLAQILRAGDVVLYENDLPDNFK